MMSTAAPTDGTVESLRSALAAVRAGDPLMPVDVVVPGLLAGVTLRRALAATGGLANVRFGSLAQTAERLCARTLALDPGGPRIQLTTAARAAAVRRALSDHPANSVAAMGSNRANARMLEGLFAELDAAAVDPRIRPTGLSPRGIEVLQLFAAYRAEMGPALSPADLLRAAAQAVRRRTSTDTHVVLLESVPLTATERNLLAELQDANRLTRVPVASARGQQSHLTIAPDAEEEVRIAVRSLIGYLAQKPVRPERLGIAFTSTIPYARLLSEQLTVAGLPHHVASGRTLAHTVAGRTLQAALTLYQRGYPRAETLTWLASGPLLTADGMRVPAQRWERLTREAGVSRGLATWRQRLERWSVRRSAMDVADTEAEDRRNLQLADVDSLRRTIDGLAADTAKVFTAQTWPEVSSAVLALLHRCLGAQRVVDRWSVATDLRTNVEVEQQSYTAVHRSLAGLAALDDTTPPTPDRLLDVLSDDLAENVPSRTTAGRGVLVGHLESFAGADVDVLVILGLTEDAAPVRQREHPILRDADRAVLSPDLATVRSRRARAESAWLSAMLSAGTVGLSTSRANTRSQRRQFASPWFLQHAGVLAGRPVSTAELDELNVEWLTRYASATDALTRSDTYASAHERDVAIALGGDVDGLATAEPRLARGLQAARIRAEGSFGEWNGGVGPLSGAVREKIDARHSASALQQWATCPTSHFFNSVLGVRDVEDLGERDAADPRERGNLIHAVLEEFLTDHLGSVREPGRAPDEAWSDTEVDDILDLFEARADAFTAAGLTGRHDAVWAIDRARLRRALTQALHADSRRRRETQGWPIAVEMAFGRDGQPPLTIELPTQGTVAFAGFIDRVDATADGGLIVLDYKTGKGERYTRQLPRRGSGKAAEDIVDRGRMLQLPLYALAARERYGTEQTVIDAGFSLVERGGVEHGAPIGELETARLQTVLDIAVGGIRAGVFPANPGTYDDHRGWTGCRYCAFDRVCPDTRGEQWRGARADPAVAEYRGLAEPEQSS